MDFLCSYCNSTWWYDLTILLKATIGNVFPGIPFGLKIGVGIDSAGTDPIIIANGNNKFASDTSGYFTIQRTGSTIDVIASTGDSTVTITGGFYSLPLVFGVQYGSNFNTLAKYFNYIKKSFKLSVAGVVRSWMIISIVILYNNKY